jgi:hypothetical protein
LATLFSTRLPFFLLTLLARDCAGLLAFLLRFLDTWRQHAASTQQRQQQGTGSRNEHTVQRAVAVLVVNPVVQMHSVLLALLLEVSLLVTEPAAAAAASIHAGCDPACCLAQAGWHPLHVLRQVVLQVAPPVLLMPADLAACSWLCNLHLGYLNTPGSTAHTTLQAAIQHANCRNCRSSF